MANTFIKFYCFVQGYGWAFLKSLDLDRSTVGVITANGVAEYPISAVRKIAIISTIPVYLCSE